MYTIYYHPMGLTPKNEEFFVKALEELTQHLAKDETKWNIQITKLDVDLADRIEQVIKIPPVSQDGTTDPDQAFADINKIAPNQSLIVCCSSTEALVRAIMQKDPLIKWGAASCGFRKALSWKEAGPGEEMSNKHLIWHETLHTLYASDHYDEHGLPTCGNKNCLMQYAPSQQTVGEWPFLCMRTINRVNNELFYHA